MCTCPGDGSSHTDFVKGISRAVKVQSIHQKVNKRVGAQGLEQYDSISHPRNLIGQEEENPLKNRLPVTAWFHVILKQSAS